MRWGVHEQGALEAAAAGQAVSSDVLQQAQAAQASVAAERDEVQSHAAALQARPLVAHLRHHGAQTLASVVGILGAQPLNPALPSRVVC